MFISSNLVIKQVKNIDDVKDILRGLSNIDADFDGNNGDDYLWPIAKKKGFKNNAEYLIDKVTSKPKKSITDNGVFGYVNEFVKLWKNSDSYYESIETNIVKLDGFAEDANIEGIYAIDIIATSN